MASKGSSFWRVKKFTGYSSHLRLVGFILLAITVSYLSLLVVLLSSDLAYLGHICSSDIYCTGFECDNRCVPYSFADSWVYTLVELTIRGGREIWVWILKQIKWLMLDISSGQCLLEILAVCQTMFHVWFRLEEQMPKLLKHLVLHWAFLEQIIWTFAYMGHLEL